MPGPIKSKTIELEFAESEIRSRKFSWATWLHTVCCYSHLSL